MIKVLIYVILSISLIISYITIEPIPWQNIFKNELLNNYLSTIKCAKYFPTILASLYYSSKGAVVYAFNPFETTSKGDFKMIYLTVSITLSLTPVS